MSDKIYHVPVMLGECIDAMKIKADGCYVDVTFGGGGHSRAILSHLGDQGHLYSFDQDPDAIHNITPDPSFTFIASNFRYLERFMDYYGEDGKVDAILADLGVSSHHFDEEDRGFSFRSDAPLLDMRMNIRSGKSARNILNEYDEEHIADMLYKYGELKQSRRLAKRIITARSAKELKTVGDLLAAIKPEINPREEKKQLACVFQAIRIEVNDELKALEDMLEASLKVLRPGGRLVVMTYHSLEDRIVKNFIKDSRPEDNSAMAQIYGKSDNSWIAVTRKPIVASPQEVQDNPRARSAKLRVAELRMKL